MSLDQPPKTSLQARGTKGLLKSTAAFGSTTVLSRITGLARDVVFAQLIGSTFVADAFFVAFRIPNFFRRIFGEGAFSAAFVPVYTMQKMSASETEQKYFVDVVTGRLSLLLLVLSVIGVILAPLLISVLAPGFRTDLDKYELTVECLRITFPYVLFICLVALSSAILNTHGRFAAPAATPILLNIALIASALWLTGLTGNAAIALSIGVLIAGLIQLLFQFPFLVKVGVVPRPRLARKENPDTEKAVNKIANLMVPAIFGTSIAQLNLIINTFIASFLVTGSVSWLYYSDRIMEFPLGVFGVALGSVMLPRLSKEYANANSAEFSRLLDWGLRWCCLIAFPSTVGLIVLSDASVATLFYHGAFTAIDVEMSGNALVAFSLGLFALMAVRILSPGFFARSDTKTPVRAGAIAMVANAVFAIVLVFSYKHVGLALATSLAAYLNAALLLYWLIREKAYTPEAGWLLFLVRTIGASFIMGGVLWWHSPGLETWLTFGNLERVIRLLLYIVTGAATYSVCVLLCGIRPRQLINK